MSASVSTSRVELPTPVVEIAWRVSPEALRRRFETSLPQGDARLVIQVETRRDGSGQSSVSVGEHVLAQREYTSDQIRITLDRERGLVHVDVEGLLACTRRGGQLVYVRAPVLAQLEIEGGRYELEPTKDAER